MKTLLLLLFVVFSIKGEAQNVAEHYKTSKFDVAIFPAKSLDMIPGLREVGKSFTGRLSLDYFS